MTTFKTATIIILILINIFIYIVSAEDSSERTEDVKEEKIAMGPTFLSQEILRDFSFNLLNLLLNWVGILVHAIFLQVFKI